MSGDYSFLGQVRQRLSSIPDADNTSTFITVLTMLIDRSTAAAGPSNTAGPSTNAPPTAPASLEDLLQFLLSGPNLGQVQQTLKAVIKETGEPLLASLLPSGQDPLDLLHPQTHTLSFLYIL